MKGKKHKKAEGGRIGKAVQHLVPERGQRVLAAPADQRPGFDQSAASEGPHVPGDGLGIDRVRAEDGYVH